MLSSVTTGSGWRSPESSEGDSVNVLVREGRQTHRGTESAPQRVLDTVKSPESSG